MVWFKGGWMDTDCLADELCQSLDFAKIPPPLKHWLIDEQAVRDRLGDIYEDMLRHTRSSREDPIADEFDAKLRNQARAAVVHNVFRQICTLMNVRPKVDDD
jgi:hypothetical protein